MVVNSYECACEGEGLAVGGKDGGVDVAGRGQHDGNRDETNAEEGCRGGDKELYFDMGAFHFN